ELRAGLHGAPILCATAETDVVLRKIIDREPWKDAALSVHAVVPWYDLSHLPRMSGVISADAEVRGTIADPIGSAVLHGSQLAFDKTRLSRAEGRAAFDRGELSASLDATQRVAGALHLSVRVPSAPDAPLSIGLRADRLTIGLGHLGALHRLDGVLD